MLALIGAENMLFVLAFGGYTIGWGQPTTRIHFGLCANVKALIAVSRRGLSIDVSAGTHRPNPELRGRSLDTRIRCTWREPGVNG